LALKLQYRRWFPFIFLGSFVAVVALWNRLPVEHRPNLVLSIIGAIATFSYFLYRQHLSETKLFKELFVEFNARYDKLNNGLNKIVDGSKQGELSENERELLFSYFNLCAEEYLFYTAGYIDEFVWQSWCRGMNHFFGHPRVRHLWDADCMTDSYYGFHPDASSHSKWQRSIRRTIRPSQQATADRCAPE
jgi:hypothetical protein